MVKVTNHVIILQNKINKPALVPPGVSLRAEEDV